VIGTPTKRSGEIHRKAKLHNNSKEPNNFGIWVEPPEEIFFQWSQSASILGLFLLEKLDCIA
jgi:hypothetical protein